MEDFKDDMLGEVQDVVKKCTCKEKDETEAECCQRKALWKFMEREGQNKVNIPLDPMQGMFLAQGSMIQHLVFAVMSIYVQSRIEPLKKAGVDPNPTLYQKRVDESDGAIT